MTLSQLVDDFLRERSRAGRKASTLRIYRMRLAPLIAALGDFDIKEISRRQWLEALHAAAHNAAGERLANDTIALTLTLLGSLQRFALDEEAIAAPWLKDRDLKKPRGRSRERTATTAETAQLLAAMTPAYRRLYTALRLTGARRGELCRARIEDLEGTDGSRSIVLAEHKSSGSQGRPRTIRLGAEADELVTAAAANRTSGPIFLDDEERPWREDRVTRIFARLRRRLGLPSELKLHATRHEFATRMVQRHGLKAAQEACGHQNVQTTTRYAHLADNYLRDCVTGLFTDDPEDLPEAA